MLQMCYILYVTGLQRCRQADCFMCPVQRLKVSALSRHGKHNIDAQ